MKKNTALVGGISIGLSALSVVALVLWVPNHIQQIKDFAENHKVIAPLMLIIWRMLAVVIPPIPGGIISLALIPVFGWWQSFIYASIGILSGVAISFNLARKFREPLVKRFIPVQEIPKWEKRIGKKMHFWTLLGLRLTTGPVLDFVSYAAGLSKIGFKRFLLVSAIGLLPDAVLYYLGDQVFKRNLYTGFLVVIGLAIFVYSFKANRTKKVG